MFLALMVCLVMSFGCLAHAQDTLPALGLPVGDSSTTAVAEETETDLYDVETATPEDEVQDYEDVAETGAEIYILAAISILVGFGIFSLKKYHDLKKITL